MKVGMNEAVELKEISTQRGIAFADFLYAYLVEDLMQRIYGSSFAECFWLLQENGQPLNEGVLHAG